MNQLGVIRDGRGHVRQTDRGSCQPPSPGAPTTLRHALTFDVEDWFHLDGIAAVEDPGGWSALPSLVEARTEEFLEICRSSGVLATFFVLGWVAEQHPDLVPRILDGGHEVATHGFWHRRLPELTREAFVRDLSASLEVLGSQGADAAGFRAPCFSLGAREHWVYDDLRRAGLRYSSSWLSGLGGVTCEGPHRVPTAAGGSVAELPISRAGLGSVRARFSGGGCFRVLPLGLVEAGLRSERRAGRPTVVYLHPRDFAPDCPRAPMPLVRRFRTYVNLDSTARKVRTLLSRYEFGTCSAVLDDMLGSPVTKGEW